MYGIVPSINHKETWNQWGICYIKQLHSVIHLRNDLSESVGRSIDYDVQEGSVGWPLQDLGSGCYVPTTAMKSIQLLISGECRYWCSCAPLWIHLKIRFTSWKMIMIMPKKVSVNSHFLHSVKNIWKILKKHYKENVVHRKVSIAVLHDGFISTNKKIFGVYVNWRCEGGIAHTHLVKTTCLINLLQIRFLTPSYILFYHF